MKIAVCVKEVPDPGPNRRIDPGHPEDGPLGRPVAERSTTCTPSSRRIRLKEAAGDGEVVLVSHGRGQGARLDPQGPRHGRRPRRARLGRGRRRLRPGRHEPRARRGARGRVARPGAVRPAGHRRRRRRAVGRRGRPPEDAGRLPDLRARGRRRQPSRRSARPSSATTRSAPRCPAVLAVADSLNEPRYPSLKGIMGAKKKPQDVEEPRRRRRGRRQRRRGRLAHHRHRA